MRRGRARTSRVRKVLAAAVEGGAVLTGSATVGAEAVGLAEVEVDLAEAVEVVEASTDLAPRSPRRQALRPRRCCSQRIKSNGDNGLPKSGKPFFYAALAGDYLLVALM